jgi:hypothetical protein
MKKLKMLLLVLVAFTTTVFSQILTTNIMYHNFTDDHVEMVHTFNMSFGENKDVAWYHNHQFNDVFQRISTFEMGFTKKGEYYKAAEYLDGKGYEVVIQYFPDASAVRVFYPHNQRVLEFFKN